MKDFAFSYACKQFSCVYTNMSVLLDATPMTACTPSIQLVSGSDTPFQVDDLDELFKGFADPTRIRLLNVLAAGELCVCDLVSILQLPQPAIARHLAYVRRRGLVLATREWKFAHYRLAEPSNMVHQTLLSCVRSCFTGVPALDVERAAAEARVRERLVAPC